MSTAVNIAELAGPQLLGQLINWGLMGALSVQTYLYYTLFPEDPLTFQCLVYGIFIFEWIQTILITQNSFNVFAQHFGDVANILKFHNSWFSVPIMCGIVSAAVQMFYARRIFVLSNSIALAAVICVLALTQCSAAIASGVLLKDIHTAADQAKTTPAIATWLGGSALADIVIAVCMTFLLLRTRTGIRHSDTLVNKLVRLVIESGTITASVAIVDVVMFAALPNTLYHECPALALAKLYANMMLTSLNNRAFLRKAKPQVSTMSTTTNNSEGTSTGTSTHIGSGYGVVRPFKPGHWKIGSGAASDAGAGPGAGTQVGHSDAGMSETVVQVDVLQETEYATEYSMDAYKPRTPSEYPLEAYKTGRANEYSVPVGAAYAMAAPQYPPDAYRGRGPVVDYPADRKPNPDSLV